MNAIQREELKEKLDRGDRVKLIMAMDHYAFDKAHIPGSLNYSNVQQAVKELKPSDEVVVYCSTRYCNDSFRAYYELRRRGIQKVFCYEGGLEDWYKAGYPLEGTLMH
jgi:rhodanese-related sulfurtransferase